MYTIGLGVALASGCAGRNHDVEQCEIILAETPALLLIGHEGSHGVCECVVDSMAVQFPDATDQWGRFAEEFDERFAARGIVGVLIDTAYTSRTSTELEAFSAAYAEAMTECTGTMLKSWVR
jgi:hypothetical protein